MDYDTFGGSLCTSSGHSSSTNPRISSEGPPSQAETRQPFEILLHHHVRRDLSIPILLRGRNHRSCKMPNDNNREMLTEVVALYLAAHMKAQAAVITTLVSILVQKGVLTEQIVRAEWLGGLEEVVRATLESPQATNPDEARASRIEIETLRQVVDWIRQRLFPSGDMF